MKKAMLAIGAGLLAASLAAAAPAPPAEEAVSVRGTWGINGWMSGDTVQLRLTYRKATSRWEWSTGQQIADLRGLAKEQLRSLSTPAEFTLERDPGVFFFEGTIMLGIGRGDFRFVPRAEFAAKLSAMGYADVDADSPSLMFLAVRDISLDYAAEVKKLGIKGLSVRDLTRFADHGIDLPFLRELAAAGYPGLTGDDIVRLRDHGIDGRYVARIQAAGFTNVTVDQIVRLHDHGVD